MTALELTGSARVVNLLLAVVEQAAAEAQAQARKGVLRSQPSDKRKLHQKGIQRIDSMQFGGVSALSILPGVSSCHNRATKFLSFMAVTSMLIDQAIQSAR